MTHLAGRAVSTREHSAIGVRPKASCRCPLSEHHLDLVLAAVVEQRDERASREPFARRALPRVHTTTAPSATRSSPRRFPGGSGYTTGLPPGPFALGTRRASPVARCVLCLRAAGSTPPMEPDASASVRQSLLPSPPTVGLGPRHLRFSRHHRRSLALRPGHSLAIPGMTWSIGFNSVGFPSGCYPSYGALALTPVGLTPTEHTCLIWTHPSAPAPGVPRINSGRRCSSCFGHTTTKLCQSLVFFSAHSQDPEWRVPTCAS